MLNKHLLDQIEAVLSRLSIPVSVMDKDGGANLPAEVRASLKEMTDGVPQAMDGMLYMPVKQPAVILHCPEKLPGARDVLFLGGALVTCMGRGVKKCYN